MAVDATLQAIAKRYRVSLDAPSPIRLKASRTDLPALCRSLGFTAGAEIGVWKGQYSKLFCEAGLAWTCVDPWQSYPAYDDNKNKPDEIHQAFLKATATLSPYGATFLRMPSVDAAKLVPDQSLDVVYIDGNHIAEFVRADVEAWLPKVKPGGLICGHDYRVNPKKPFIQVKQAIDRYTSEHAIALWFLFAGDRSPSFLWVVE
jgi:hypothetical protein